jgi:hypothetical protein
MDSNSTTELKLSDVLDELRRREPIFHRPEFATTRADLERITAEEFWEVGASGRRYSREFVLEVIEERGVTPPGDDWEMSDVRCQEIAADNFLFTYTLAQGPRITRRATIWRRTEEGWKIVYHQGTLVEDR